MCLAAGLPRVPAAKARTPPPPFLPTPENPELVSEAAVQKHWVEGVRGVFEDYKELVTFLFFPPSASPLPSIPINSEQGLRISDSGNAGYRQQCLF